MSKTLLQLQHARAWRERNAERIRAYNRSYQQRNRERNTRWTREWRAKHPERLAAHKIVARAIEDGDLIRPGICERCEQECVPSAHHNDYEKPLEVEWLCSRCHRREHGHQ